MYRQGDVLLIPTDENIPENMPEVPREQGRVVLAHGEATGHMHGIGESRVRFFRDDGLGRSFLNVEEPAVLRHQEHGPIDLPAGRYRVIRQREYTPEEIRNVAD